mmetsp:Transcript_23093/g.51413  ORF Transcript_23093/g.51413 Transcript_23093/m.51413 type:complete len:298 (-) Transcript_23093:164-1057(-)
MDADRDVPDGFFQLVVEFRFDLDFFKGLLLDEKVLAADFVLAEDQIDEGGLDVLQPIAGRHGATEGQKEVVLVRSALGLVSTLAFPRGDGIDEILLVVLGVELVHEHPVDLHGMDGSDGQLVGHLLPETFQAFVSQNVFQLRHVGVWGLDFLGTNLERPLHQLGHRSPWVPLFLSLRLFLVCLDHYLFVNGEIFLQEGLADRYLLHELVGGESQFLRVHPEVSDAVDKIAEEHRHHNVVEDVFVGLLAVVGKGVLSRSVVDLLQVSLLGEEVPGFEVGLEFGCVSLLGKPLLGLFKV